MCWFLFPNSNNGGANIQKNTNGDTKISTRSRTNATKSEQVKDMDEDDDDDGIEPMSLTPSPLLPGTSRR